ncbi:hypothetical protein H206_06339 [Candidatus Electrothrix aarhusensis]|uniref:Uncharacterized protein n=1 Tax=Candidatus Electrothrix aarhusensis TaxID=1859131 RepID=A0A3S4TCA3_9BACT|nr:hypothetical protein H206_06339 [Candidatus Electrothrix aarhusensis]
MHPAHGVGHAVGSRSGSHIIRVQRPTGTAAGSHREVFLALLQAFLLIGTCYRMLEAGRVGRITGDGDIHPFMMVDSHTLTDIISTIAAYLSPKSLRERFFRHNIQGAAGIIKLGPHIGKAVDSGDDISSILAQTVENDP